MNINSYNSNNNVNFGSKSKETEEAKNGSNKNKKSHKLLKAAVITTAVAAGSYLAYKNIKKGGKLKDAADFITRKFQDAAQDLKDGVANIKNKKNASEGSIPRVKGKIVSSDKMPQIEGPVIDVYFYEIDSKGQKILNSAKQDTKILQKAPDIEALPMPKEHLALPEPKTPKHVSKKDIIRLPDTQSGPVIYVEPKVESKLALPESKQVLALPEPKAQLALPESKSMPQYVPPYLRDTNGTPKLTKEEAQTLINTLKAKAQGSPNLPVNSDMVSSEHALMVLPKPSNVKGPSKTFDKDKAAALAGLGLIATAGGIKAVTGDDEEPKAKTVKTQKELDTPDVITAGSKGVGRHTERTFKENGDTVLREYNQIRDKNGKLQKIPFRETTYSIDNPDVVASEKNYSKTGEFLNSKFYEYSPENKNLLLYTKEYDANNNFTEQVTYKFANENDFLPESKLHTDKDGNKTLLEEGFVKFEGEDEPFATKLTRYNTDGSSVTDILDANRNIQEQISYPKEKYGNTPEHHAYFDGEGNEIKGKDLYFDKKINLDNPSKAVFYADSEVTGSEKYYYKNDKSDWVILKNIFDENSHLISDVQYSDKYKDLKTSEKNYAKGKLSADIKYFYDENIIDENHNPLLIKERHADLSGSRNLLEDVIYNYSKDYKQVLSRDVKNVHGGLLRKEESLVKDFSGQYIPGKITEYMPDGRTAESLYDGNHTILEKTTHPSKAKYGPVIVETFVKGNLDSIDEEFYGKDNPKRLDYVMSYDNEHNFVERTEYEYLNDNPELPLISVTYGEDKDVLRRLEYEYDNNERMTGSKAFKGNDEIPNEQTKIIYLNKGIVNRTVETFKRNEAGKLVLDNEKDYTQDNQLNETRQYNDKKQVETRLSNYIFNQWHQEVLPHKISHYEDGILKQTDTKSALNPDFITKKEYFSPNPQIDSNGKPIPDYFTSIFEVDANDPETYYMHKAAYDAMGLENSYDSFDLISTIEQHHNGSTNELLFSTVNHPSEMFNTIYDVLRRTGGKDLKTDFESNGTQTDVFSIGDPIDSAGNRACYGTLDRTGKSPDSFKAYFPAVYNRAAGAVGKVNFEKHFDEGKDIHNDTIYDIHGDAHSEASLYKEDMEIDGQKATRYYFWKPILADIDDKWKIVAKERVVQSNGDIYDYYRDPRGRMTHLIVEDKQGVVRHIVQMDPEKPKGLNQVAKVSFDEKGMLDRTVVYKPQRKANGKGQEIAQKIYY